MTETVIDWIVRYGYVMIFTLLMLGIFGIPVPDETLLTFSGYMVHRGDLHALPALIAAFTGSACGITLSYVVGRTGGSLVIRKYGHHVRVTPEAVDRVKRWFELTGKWALLIGYFLPGVRHLTALTAGTSKLRFPVFALFAYTGGLLWTSTFITVGYVFGEEWSKMSSRLHHDLLIGSGVVVIIIVLYFVLKRLK
jgi:membrane protein DedA with SNARE-associated domain